MHLVLIIFRQYPWRTLSMLVALLLSGIAEGIGLSAMLPLLTITLGGAEGIAGKQTTAAGEMIRNFFDMPSVSLRRWSFC